MGKYPQQHSTVSLLTKEEQQLKKTQTAICTQTPAYMRTHSRLPEEFERNRHKTIRSH